MLIKFTQNTHQQILILLLTVNLDLKKDFLLYSIFHFAI